MHIGFIGAGQMARALARGFVEGGCVSAGDIWAADCSDVSRAAFSQDVAGAQVTTDNRQVMQVCSTVFLAVKPQALPIVMQELRTVVGDRLLVSIAAGVNTGQLAAGLGTQRLVRVMPNMPCLVGQGASGFSRASGASEDDAQLVGRLLRTVGQVWELPESLLHAVTGLSGSGPAFVFQMLEALSDGGVLVGLPRATATALAAQTMLGAALAVLKTGEHPGELKDRVASPGGTTIAGLLELERGGVRGALMNAVQAATARSRQIELEARA